MAAIDSKISLAIATKLQKIFEVDDKFLVFPSGIGFEYRELSFMDDLSKSGLSALEQLNFKGQFARLLNIVPNDSPLYTPDAQSFLWNRTIDTLRNAVFATSTLTPAEEEQLSQATNYLIVQQTQSDGTTIPVSSMPLTKYYEYKTIYDNRNSDYLDEKTTVENSSGPGSEALKHQWTQIREKQLTDAVMKSEQDWKNFGFKIIVENYQSLKNNLELKKYSNNYGTAYQNEIEMGRIADVNNQGLPAYITFYSPSDAFDKTVAWPSITLTKQEMNSLIQTASASVKAIFSAGTGDDDIELISLEYNNVAILRPWFKQEFFSSRFWKLSDNKVVSDGNTPRKGLIPAYITSVLTVRNIKITKKKGSPSKPVLIPLIGSIPLESFKNIGTIQKIPEVAQKKQFVLTSAAKTMVNIKFDNDRQNLFETAKMVVATPQIAKETVISANVNTAAIFNTNNSSFVNLKTATGLSAPTTNIAISAKATLNYENVKFLGTTIKSPIYTTTPKAPVPVPDPTAPVLVTETFPISGVMILAYVCKRVPKSPFPDESFKW